MKRIFTVIGALLILTGVRAQTSGRAKKETAKPIRTTPASGVGNGSGSTGAPVVKRPGTPPSAGNGSGSTGAPVAKRPGAGAPPPTRRSPLPSTPAPTSLKQSKTVKPTFVKR